MGLHNTAHYLKTKGRGDDTELVHMTKGEVHALKGLAAKHGGQLTINPETGLPEAGFLSAVLPMVAGVATAAFAPELLPLVAGGIGIADYAMTGSIGQGLMAGLSAYGGGQLGTSLAGMGAEAGVEGLAANQAAALEGTTAGFDSSTYSNLSADQLSGYKEAFANAPNSEIQKGILQSAAQANASLGAPAASSLTGMQNLSNMGTGLSAAAKAPGSFLMNNASNLAMASAPILTGALNQRSTLPGAASTTSTNPMGMKTIPTDANGKPIFSPTIPTPPANPYKAQYPNYVKNPYDPYAPTGYAAGGSIASAPPTPGLMDGGTSGNVDFMGGDMYPTSQQNRSYYATPIQAPTSAQSAMASYEPKTNPLTGEPTANMREGGIASYSGTYGSVVEMNQATQDLQNMYTPKPMSAPHVDAGIYQDTDPNTRNLDAYSRALYMLNAKTKAAGMKKGSADSLKPTLKLGDIEEDAAGGIVGMATGGVTPQITQQGLRSPAELQAATQAYTQQGVPVPTRPEASVVQQAQTKPLPQTQANFNSDAYLAANPDVKAQLGAKGVESAWNHYQNFGQKEGRAFTYNPVDPNQPAPNQPASAPRDPSTGYTLDPTQMVGSPAYLKAQQNTQAATDSSAQNAAFQAWQQQQYQNYLNSQNSSGGGYSGGIMPQDLRYAGGGFVPSLGGYAAGGNPRLLKGPGDGMSDSIPANIGGKQPARLADGEFVVPADVVSHLGNGSTDAGAKKLYTMMDNIRRARTGRKKQAPAVKPDKYLPK